MVAGLRAASTFPARARTSESAQDERRAVGGRSALDCLLERLDARSAAWFVEEQLGALTAHDREHGTSLQRVLELALDHGDRGAAAQAAFMHRNTFRRQLRNALELLDTDLERPEERLAVHLALKLRRRV